MVGRPPLVLLALALFPLGGTGVRPGPHRPFTHDQVAKVPGHRAGVPRGGWPARKPPVLSP